MTEWLQTRDVPQAADRLNDPVDGCPRTCRSVGGLAVTEAFEQDEVSHHDGERVVEFVSQGVREARQRLLHPRAHADRDRSSVGERARQHLLLLGELAWG